MGAGTGHFTRRFAQAGLAPVGVDPSRPALDFARQQSLSPPYVAGRAEALPFHDDAFDYAAAVTSLCFVADPRAALAEMWRVARHGVVVGLLNRRSLLHRRKAGSGGYAGARWDTLADAQTWATGLQPAPAALRWGTAVLGPGGSRPARLLEPALPRHLPWGAFLAVYWARPGGDPYAP